MFVFYKKLLNKIKSLCGEKMIEEVMKKDVGKIFSWQGKEIIIMKSFSCYEGDFYEYRFINDEYDNVHRINIWTSEGNEFIKALEEYKSP